MKTRTKVLRVKEAEIEIDRAIRITNAMTHHAIRHRGCDCCSQILVEAGEIPQ